MLLVAVIGGCRVAESDAVVHRAVLGRAKVVCEVVAVVRWPLRCTGPERVRKLQGTR